MHWTRSGSWQLRIRIFWEVKQSFKLKFNSMRINMFLKLWIMVSEWLKTSLLTIWALLPNLERRTSWKIWKAVTLTLLDSLVWDFIPPFWWPHESKLSQNTTTTSNTSGSVQPPIPTQSKKITQSLWNAAHWSDFTWKRTPQNTAHMNNCKS